MTENRCAFIVVYAGFLIAPGCVDIDHSIAASSVEFRDAKGTVWRLRGPARYAPETHDALAAPDEPTAIGPTDADISTWTVDDWAERLRPIAFFDGNEYELVESNAEYMARLRAAVHGGHPSAGTPTGTASALPRQLGGGIMPRAVIGTDDRTAIPLTSVEDYPNRAIGVTADDDISSRAKTCTMTLIGPSTAVSAAHCFYNSGVGWQPGKAWVFGASTKVGVGQVFTYGTGVGSGCYWVTIPGGFATSNTIFDDYAVIEFSNSQAPTCHLFPGNTLGWFGFWEASNTQIRDTGARINGYPNPAPGTFYVWPSEYEHVLEAEGVLVDGTSSYILRHTIDATGGDSGAGLAQAIFGGTDRYITGIHKGTQGGVTTSNWARRMNSTVTAFISANSAL